MHTLLFATMAHTSTRQKNMLPFGFLLILATLNFVWTCCPTQHSDNALSTFDYDDDDNKVAVDRKSACGDGKYWEPRKGCRRYEKKLDLILTLKLYALSEHGNQFGY